MLFKKSTFFNMIVLIDPNLRITPASSTSCLKQPVPVYKLLVWSVKVTKGDSTERVGIFRNWLMPTTVLFSGVRFNLKVSWNKPGHKFVTVTAAQPSSPFAVFGSPLGVLTPVSDFNWEQSLSALWQQTTPRCGDKVQWRWRHEEEKGRETGWRPSLWRTNFGTAFYSDSTMWDGTKKSRRGGANP